jgi:hypothetical protein
MTLFPVRFELLEIMARNESPLQVRNELPLLKNECYNNFDKGDWRS